MTDASRQVDASRQADDRATGDERRLPPERVAELHNTYADRLRAFLIGLLRKGDLAEEVVQNTFQIALLKGGDVGGGSYQAWLFQVAYNEAMAVRRREQIDIRALRKLASEPEHGLPADTALIQQEEIERLHAAIRQLPIDQQTIVKQRLHGEQTFQQMADELALPLGTVLTRMRLALDKLRNTLNRNTKQNE